MAALKLLRVRVYGSLEAQTLGPVLTQPARKGIKGNLRGQGTEEALSYTADVGGSQMFTLQSQGIQGLANVHQCT